MVPTYMEYLVSFTKLYRALPERERNIIMWRFGLDGQPVKSLNQIGEIYGVSNERIRQIERRTLDRMFEQMNGSTD